MVRHLCSLAYGLPGRGATRGWHMHVDCLSETWSYDKRRACSAQLQSRRAEYEDEQVDKCLEIHLIGLTAALKGAVSAEMLEA